MSNYRRRMIQNMGYGIVDLSLRDVYGNSINRSTANCYVVREPGQYKFPLVWGNAIKNGKVNTAAFTNNGGSNSHDFVNFLGYLIESPYIEYDATPILLNSDTDGVIANISLIEESDCKYIQFDVLSVPSVGANAIISYDEVGWSNWSWHIWLWPHDLSPVEITNATGVKYNIMPVNLASKYDSDGVHIKNWFYQWGRKDPMLCPASYNSTANHSPGTITIEPKAGELETGIKYPTTFYYNERDIDAISDDWNWFGDKNYYNLWDAACTSSGDSDNDTVKTVYDPCPVGWKVPNGNTFTGLSILSNANGIVKMRRYSNDTIGVEFPMSGCRYYSDGSLNEVGYGGFVWLSSANTKSMGNMMFSDGYIRPNGYSIEYTPPRGQSIRPVQDDITKIDEL